MKYLFPDNSSLGVARSCALESTVQTSYGTQLVVGVSRTKKKGEGRGWRRTAPLNKDIFLKTADGRELIVWLECGLPQLSGVRHNTKQMHDWREKKC